MPTSTTSTNSNCPSSKLIQLVLVSLYRAVTNLFQPARSSDKQRTRNRLIFCLFWTIGLLLSVSQLAQAQTISVTDVKVSGCYLNSNGTQSQATARFLVRWTGLNLSATSTNANPRAIRLLSGTQTKVFSAGLGNYTSSGSTAVSSLTIVSPQIFAFEFPLTAAPSSVTLSATLGVLSGTTFTPSTAAATPSATITVQLPAACPQTACASGGIGGVVFNDYNADGVRDVTTTVVGTNTVSSGETQGVGGVTVTVYDNAGNSFSTVSDQYGYYAFTQSLAYPARVEFTSIPATYASSATPNGASSRTTTQFISAASCSVNLGVNTFTDYCNTSPRIFVPCYVNGDPTKGGTAGTDDALVSIPFNAAGTNFTTATISGANSYWGKASQIGATWGLAYSKQQRKLFLSSIIRRHVGFGPLGIGGIYVTDVGVPTKPASSTATSSFINLAAAPFNVPMSTTFTSGANVNFNRDLPANKEITSASNGASRDAVAYPLVAKEGLGDLEISDDGNTLYTINLRTKQLLALDLTTYNATGVVPNSASQLTFTTIPDPGCVSGNWRPWATKVYKGDVYIGGVCDASTGTGTADEKKANLWAYVMKYNGTAFTPVLDFPLTYPKGFPYSSIPNFTGWYPWTDTFSDLLNTVTNFTTSIAYPQPMLMDIEFDTDGSMLLGLGDRTALQTGISNLRPDGTSTTLYTAYNGGDMLKAYARNGIFILENNGQAGPFDGYGANNNQGPGFGEYFNDDWFFSGTKYHTEAILGALAIRPGSGQTLATSIDPQDNNAWAGGIRLMNNNTGLRVAGYSVYGTSSGNNDPTTGDLGKAAGLGDIEITCDIPTYLQLGNRVWHDKNQNGIQDPGEAGLAGVSAKLFPATATSLTTPIATTTTDANGEYYFSGLLPTTNYVIVFGDGQQVTGQPNQVTISGVKFTVTSANIGEGSAVNKDMNDSDGSVLTTGVFANKIGITVTTGIATADDHTDDLGIFCDVPVLADIPSQTVCAGTFDLPLSTSVVSNTVTSQQWYNTNQAGTTFTAISGANSLTYSPLAANQPTAGTTKYYAIIAQNGGAICADTAFVSLTQKVSPTIAFSAPTAATVTQCSNTTLNLSVTTNAVAPDGVQFVYFTSPQSGTAMYTGGTVLASATSTTATGNKTLTRNVTLPTVVGADQSVLYVYAILQSADGTCKPVDSFILRVNPQPVATIGGPMTVCQGTAATFTLPPGLSYKWSTGATTRQISPLISATTTTAVYSATLTNVGGCVSDPATFTVTGVACTSCISGAGRVGGTVFADFDANGVQTPDKPGLSGVIVTIFACDLNGNSTQVGTTTTDFAGGYFFSGLTDGVTYRVEFSNAPAGFNQSAKGANSGTSVQFVKSPTCAANLGLSNAINYCAADAPVAVVCFARNNDGATEPTIITISYADGIDFAPRGATDANKEWSTPTGTLPATAKTTVATVGSAGTTFGLTWDKTHRQLLSGAFMRAYAPMKANTSANSFGEGIIYKIDYTSGTAVAPTTWLDLETVLTDGVSGTYVADATYPGSQVFGRANSNPAKIGYTGLGSMRMAADNSELYVVNLNKLEVLVIPVDAAGSPVTAQLKRFPLPTDGCPTGNWSDGRPYRAALGLGVHPSTKRVYATVTCTGPTLSDVKGLVYSFNPADGSPSTASFQLETSIPLNSIIPATNPNVTVWYEQIVHPWDVVTANTAFYENSSSNTAQHTQPWLGEIEFDQQPDGTYGMMVGTRNRYHDIINSSFYVTGGVLHRVGNTGTDAAPAWSLESNAVAAGMVSTVGWTLNGASNAGGNTDSGDRFFKYVGREGTMLSGTLDYVPGRPEVVLPAMDNIFNSGTSGMTWLNRTTGERSRDARLLADYSAGAYDNVNFTKSNNWGGVVVMCADAPIQIGNRVWRDDNRNGIQDPCEPAIAGAVVKLYDAAKTTVLASVTTNAAGEYYFSSTTITTGNSSSAVATTALTPNTTFGLVITSLGTGTAVTGLTLTDVSPVTPGESGTLNSGTTINNNDAKVDVVGGIASPCIKLTTGGPGQTNHTYDFGIAKFVCSLTATASASSTTALLGQPVTLSTQVTPAGSYTYAWSGPASVTITPANAATVTASGLAVGVNTFTVTVTSSPACQTTATVSVTVLAPAVAVAVGTPVCNTLTNNYTATGTVSLTNAQAGNLTITDNSTTIATIAVTTGQTSATFSATGVSGSTPPSHTVVAALGTATASTTYATPASCTVCSLSITTTVLAQGQVGTSYSQTITTTGGTAPVSYSLIGSLPVGLALNPTTGAITGTPTASGTASFTIKVTDGKACTALVPLSIITSNAPVCSLTVTASPGVCDPATNRYSVLGSVSATNVAVNNASPQTLTISVGSSTTIVTLTGNGPLSYTLAGLLSDGLVKTLTVTSSASVCGAVSTTFAAPVSCTPVLTVVVGTPVCNTLTNNYTATGTVSLTNAQTGSLTITDNSTTIATIAVTTGQTSATFSATGVSGSTPPSHTVVAALGTVTASTTYATPASCTVCSLSITTTVLAQGQVGTAYLQTITTTNGTAPLSFSVGGGSLPAGLLLNTTTGIVSGTPTLATTSTFSVVVTDGKACTALVPLSIITSSAPVCSLTATATPTTCNTATNQYSVVVSVGAVNSPAIQNLTLTVGNSSTVVTLTGNGPESYTLTGLTSDGLAKTLTVLSSATACGTASATFTAPESCTVAVCILPTNAVAAASCLSATNGSGQIVATATGSNIEYRIGSGAFGLSGVFTGLTNGLYVVEARIVGTIAPGCSVTTTATVSCNCLPPTLTVQSPSTTVCGPATFDLTSTSIITQNTGTRTLYYTSLVTANAGGSAGQLSNPQAITASGTYYVRSETNDIGCYVVKPFSVTIVDCRASLGDKVFADNNANGLYDTGDTPIPGVIVTLISNETVVQTTTTASSGTGIGCYSFTGLTPGVPYSVSFTTPVGFTATTPLSGTDKAIDSDPVNGITAPVTLTAGENNTTIDAGFVPQLGSIGDRVWKDNNNNGQLDPNEPPVAGITVELYAVTGGVLSTTPLATTVTSASGLYAFTGLPSGQYQVKFTIPASQTDACQLTDKPNAGTDDTKDSDANPVTGLTPIITIDVTQPASSTARNNLTIDAGLQRKIYDPVGYIYCYKDGKVLKGGTVSISGPGSVTITQSGINGYYQFFTDGTPGSYTLSYNNPNAFGIATAVRPPAGSAIDPTGLEGTPTDKDGELNGWIQLGSDVNADSTALLDASAAANPYFVVFNVQPGDPFVSENNLPIDCTPPTGSIGDLVWKDLNNNGQYDVATETGVAGVMVSLLQVTSPVGASVVSTSLVSTTSTDGNGTYLFSGLPAGRYIVAFDKTTLPVNCVLSPDYKKASVPEELDSDADPQTGRSPIVELVPADPAKRDILTVDAALIVPECPPAKCIPIVLKRIR